MKRKQEWLTTKKYIVMVKIALLVFVFGIVVFGFFSPRDVTIYTHDAFTTLDHGWLQIIREESIPLETIKKPIIDSDHSPLIIEHTITNDMINQCVLFYAQHQDVSIYVNNQLIYQLMCPPSFSIFGTAGRSWINIHITEAMIGQTLRLTFNSSYPTYHGLPSEIYCIAENAIYAVQVDFLLIRNTVALLMLVLAIISYINAILWKQHQTRRFLFSLADVYLFIGLWLCAEVNVLAIWFGRTPISAVLAMIFSRIIPIVFYHYFMTILPYTSWRTKLAGGLVWINLLISLLLQFIFGISLLYLIPLNTTIIIISCFLGLMEIGYYHGSKMQFLTYRHACYWTIVLFLAALAECYIYIHYQTYEQWMGIPICFACVIYYIVTHIFLVSTQSHTADEKYRLEEAFSNLHKTPLNQQINAHFLYNSLNTISGYCKENSEQAYEAIRLLGQYMRAYTKLVCANEYVPLEEELDLMQTYMAIQNMRFEDSIFFTVQNTCDDVLLPPLTLQPLVENSINHGIRKRDGRGKISITTCYKYNMAEIIVSDDGVGFDISTLKATSGVGLKNLKHRIKAMGGSYTIQSTKGKGTDIILMVPIKDDTLEEDEFDPIICR